MPQDAFTLRYLCEELNGIFKGGKINRIVQPKADETVLSVYTKSGLKKLLLGVDPACPRIGITETESYPAVPSPNFCMLLKKHILSATVKNISLVWFDRIVKIELIPSAEFFDSPEKSLYVELMGRYSNVILTENGKVLGGNRGINFLDNNVRPLIAGLKYTLPPVGDKKEPKDPVLKEIFNDTSSITAENLCKNVQGLAISTAQEIVLSFDTSKICGSDCGEKFYEHLNNYVYNTVPHPCVLCSEGHIIDVCVYPYKSLAGTFLEYPALYVAEDVYFTEKSAAKDFKNLKDKLSGIVSAGIKKAKKRLSAVTARIKDAESAEENRLKGELILANVYKLKGGEKQAEFDNYYDGTKITVTLDERLSPALNAEAYYKKYNKQKRAFLSLAPQKDGAEAELNYLESVESEISLSIGIDDLKAVEEELTLSGFIRKPQTKKSKKVEETVKPRTYDIYGFTVKVGKNNVENDKVTFTAKPTDLWLHAKTYHSSHVIIETNGKKPPDKVIVAAAEVCAYYSKGRDGGKTEIVYCERKFVKKPKKSPLGFCTYSDFKSITVEPNPYAEMLKIQ